MDIPSQTVLMQCEKIKKLKALRTKLRDENKTLKHQLEVVLRSREKHHGHFCQEWDFMYIEDDWPEFEACTCFKEEKQ